LDYRGAAQTNRSIHAKAGKNASLPHEKASIRNNRARPTAQRDTAQNALKMTGLKTMTAETQIKDTVTNNDVVLFMKGTKTMPQCGFSSRVAGVLNFMNVEYSDVNVLADEEVRQGIKDFSDWPTIPQLYVKGEFVGGCDIITEMMLSGELDTLFADNGVTFDKNAADQIREANA
jgi:monothiol glutaredoxin